MKCTQRRSEQDLTIPCGRTTRKEKTLRSAPLHFFFLPPLPFLPFFLGFLMSFTATRA